MTTKHNKPELRFTKNYSLFEPHPYNREVTNTKVLELSMGNYGFDEGLPIRCVRNGSGKLKITHGHHRFYVARKLGLHVWYVVAENDIPLFESEASGHQWDVRDYTVARSRAGEEDVATALRFHEETGIPLTVALSLMGGEGAGSSNKSKAMKTGKYKLGDRAHADAVADITKHCEECGFKFAKNNYFVKALDKCLFVPEFDKNLFKRKVSVHSELMGRRRGVDDYLAMIELVYNRQQKHKIPLVFRANEESAKRNVIRGSNSTK